MNGLLLAVALALSLFWVAAVFLWRIGPIAIVVLLLAIGVLAVALMSDSDA